MPRLIQNALRVLPFVGGELVVQSGLEGLLLLFKLVALRFTSLPLSAAMPVSCITIGNGVDSPLLRIAATTEWVGSHCRSGLWAVVDSSVYVARSSCFLETA